MVKCISISSFFVHLFDIVKRTAFIREIWTQYTYWFFKTEALSNKVLCVGVMSHENKVTSKHAWGFFHVFPDASEFYLTDLHGPNGWMTFENSYMMSHSCHLFDIYVVNGRNWRNSPWPTLWTTFTLPLRYEYHLVYQTNLIKLDRLWRFTIM